VVSRRSVEGNKRGDGAKKKMGKGASQAGKKKKVSGWGWKERKTRKPVVQEGLCWGRSAPPDPPAMHLTKNKETGGVASPYSGTREPLHGGNLKVWTRRGSEATSICCTTLKHGRKKAGLM